MPCTIRASHTIRAFDCRSSFSHPLLAKGAPPRSNSQSGWSDHKPTGTYTAGHLEIYRFELDTRDSSIKLLPRVAQEALLETSSTSFSHRSVHAERISERVAKLLADHEVAVQEIVRRPVGHRIP